MPLDLILTDCFPKDETPSPIEFVYNKGLEIQKAYALARQCMQKRAETRIFRYDQRVKPVRFEKGQKVLYFYPRHRQGLKDKWSSYYTGPYEIVEQVGPVLYKIRKSPRAQHKLVYVDKLKPFHGLSEEEEELEKEVPDENLNISDLEGMPEERIASRPHRLSKNPVRYGFND